MSRPWSIPPERASLEARRIQPPSPAASAPTPTAAVADEESTSTSGACIKIPMPSRLSVNTNGTRNAGSVYFHVSIIVWNGFPPVMAAAANGDSAVGGLTSDKTA